MYAADQGVSLREAVRRLKLQNGPVGDSASRLEAKLTKSERKTFAGLYIQHKPNYRVIVLLTKGARETVRPYIDNPSLARLVEVRPAEVTLAELNTAQVEANRVTDVQNIPSESFVDVMNNNVKLRVAKQGRLGTTLRESGIRLPEHVKVVGVNEFLKPTARREVLGGLRIYPPNNRYCTTAFSVVHRDGRPGIITAGHCSNNMYVRGVRVPLQGSGRHYGPYDVQWHTTPGLTDRNYFWDGRYRHPVRSVKGRNRQKLNDHVCKYGRRTGYGCGYIRSKTFSRVTARNATRTWIYVRRARGTRTLTLGGDSGGPWFTRNTALGVQSGGNANEAAYMAINYVQDLGLRVRIAR